MKRRHFLHTLGALTVTGCQSWPIKDLFNACLGEIPESLLRHELVVTALDGLNAEQLWDGHVHLVGTGDSNSGLWVNPDMESVLHPVQFTQFRFYLNASCTDPISIDKSYLAQLLLLQSALPTGNRLLLLAFDYTHDEHGRRHKELSAFHCPNEHAAKVAARYPHKLEWIASIHPYRKDCVEVLKQVVEKNARAVKWLPPAMGIDPASPLCDPFYAALRQYDLPLLVHAGKENAVHGAQQEAYGNPLLLRRALDHGVRVIIAHCASLGESVDLDRGKNGPMRSNFDLFTRMMGEPEYENLLYGEISAITQKNRMGKPLETIVSRREWHPRLVNGSDYPLPAVIPLFSLDKMLAKNFITVEQMQILNETRKYNALLFDLLLKRFIRIGNHRLSPIVFSSRRVYLANKRVS